MGGLQTVTSEIATGLVAYDHTTYVIANRYPHALPTFEQIDDVPVRRWLFVWPSMPQAQAKQYLWFFLSLVWAPIVLLRLIWFVQKWQPDVINMHFPDGQTPFVLWLRRWYKGKLVISFHGDDIERYFSVDHDRNPKRLGKLLDTADSVTACSQYILDQVIKLFPQVANKGVVAHNSVNLKRFEDKTAYKHTSPYVLAYGRFTPKKGFDLLIQAWSQSEYSQKGYDLILVGSGDEKNKLQTIANNCTVSNTIYFFGRATPNEVVHLLNGCHLVVIPSRQEPFGIVALEALAAHKPILATNVGGLPFVLESAANNHNDYHLVEPNVASLVTGLNYCLTHMSHVVFAGVNPAFSEDAMIMRYNSILCGKEHL